ncbi:MAG: oxidoreductase [Pseudomonadales bacterium]|nr:oxidoreductase [Pseudomonadales bacterium]
MKEAQALPENERQRCEVWTRVMGYHRPVAAFNPGKQSEHHERCHFTEMAVRKSAQA